MRPSRRRLLASAAAGLALAPGQAAAIVGGQDAPAGRYPSIANVGIGAPGVSLFGCTGTLIAPTWVLTAGHCSSPGGATGGCEPRGCWRRSPVSA